MSQESPVTRQFGEYFDVLIDAMDSSSLIERDDVKSGTPLGCDRRVIVVTAFPGLEYHVGFWGGKPDGRRSADVYLWIARPGGNNEAAFNCFQSRQASIRAAVGPLDGRTKWDWTWPTNKKSGYGSIGVTQPFQMQDLQDRPDDLRAWMIEFLPRLRQALDPHIPKCGQMLNRRSGP